LEKRLRRNPEGLSKSLLAIFQRTEFFFAVRQEKNENIFFRFFQIKLPHSLGKLGDLDSHAEIFRQATLCQAEALLIAKALWEDRALFQGRARNSWMNF
jgi:hypothetical protein